MKKEWNSPEILNLSINSTECFGWDWGNNGGGYDNKDTNNYSCNNDDNGDNGDNGCGSGNGLDDLLKILFPWLF